VSKNPFVQFSFKGGKPGDKIALAWIDNRGERRTDEATIA
jgi:sulfur-oxidizing protein SoxZ